MNVGSETNKTLYVMLLVLLMTAVAFLVILLMGTEVL